MKIWEFDAEVGESPFWDDASEHLFWIDIRKPRLFRCGDDGKVLDCWNLPAPVGGFAVGERGDKAIIALSTGLAILDFGTGLLTSIVDPEPDKPENRLNEGKVSPCGKYFVFGSMNDCDPTRPTGSLYCMSSDLSVRHLVGDLCVANGVAWSPDELTFYFSDSRASKIWAADWDSTRGTIENIRPFASPTEKQGRPDGAAMDMEGHYWSAGVSAGVLNRYSPSGSIVQTIRLPVQAPTMPAFGPQGLLYVTSHRRVANPGALDGSIVLVPVPQQGTPQRRFRFPC